MYQGRGWYFEHGCYALESVGLCRISSLVLSSQHFHHELLMSSGTNKSKNHLSYSISNYLKVKIVFNENHIVHLIQFRYDVI